MGKRRKCRIWWPSNLSSQTPAKSSFLFGWFISSSEASLDIVVAFACDELKLTSSINPHLDLQEILQKTNKNMPALLQDKCKFSLLGYFEEDYSGNGQLVDFRNNKNNYINFTSGEQRLNTCTSNNGSCSCGCPKLDGLLEQGRVSGLENMWIKVVYGLSQTMGRRVHVIPKLDHVHLNRETVFHLDLHSSNNGTSPCKRPKWFDDLHQKDGQLDLDTVIQAMNSANAAQMLFDGHRPADSGLRFHIIHMFSTFAWKLFAVSAASLSTVIYVVLQFSQMVFSCVSDTCIYMVLAKVFSNTWQNIHFRCCQFLYWPIFLQDHSIRYGSCVEFAQKAGFHKHSIWSSVVVDVLLGNLFGVGLWFMTEPTCLWVSNFAHDFTDWLRTGCVWLMGNPAGFKLNTELAGVLGMISLNAIQIWSTLWVFMGFLFVHFTKGLALCGMLFGLTAAAALVVDTILLVTMHVSTLHLFLSLLYSTQIQEVAALWRLFRGVKRNPLRHRLDSYDYTVEHHVVGSLLFTPILLLIPTTSAFHIFFTILHSAVSFICIVVEIAISLIHSTPYAKVFLWLKRKKRFPSGIWFEVTSCQHSKTGAVGHSSSSRGNLQNAADASSSKSTILVSFLHSNYMNLGEVVRPHYRFIYSDFSRSSIGSSAYGLLTGRSIPYAPGATLPLKLPWIAIPWKEYWRLCHDSVHACGEDPYNNLN